MKFGREDFYVRLDSEDAFYLELKIMFYVPHHVLKNLLLVGSLKGVDIQ